MKMLFTIFLLLLKKMKNNLKLVLKSLNKREKMISQLHSNVTKNSYRN